MIAKVFSNTISRQNELAFSWQVGKNDLIISLIAIVIDQSSLLFKFLYSETLTAERRITVYLRFTCDSDQLWLIGNSNMQKGRFDCAAGIGDHLFVIV